MRDDHSNEVCEPCRKRKHKVCEVGINYLTEGIIKGIVCACRIAGHPKTPPVTKQ